MTTTAMSHKAQVEANKAAGLDLPIYTTERPLEFRLKTDAKGTVRARYVGFRSMRSFGIALAVVRKMEAEGRAVEVPFLITDPGIFG